MVDFSIKGRKALVTGGSRGLGYSMAKALHDAGAEVLIVGRQDHVKDAAERLGAEGAPVHYCQVDLVDIDAMRAMVPEALEKLGGRIDILVNCAGIQYRCMAEDYPEEEWRKIIEVNLNAVFFMSQEVGRIMLKQGYGKIINVASMNCWGAATRIPAYVASKGAVGQLTKALSNDWCARGINVNAIARSYMETDMMEDLQKVNPEHFNNVNSRIPMGRWGKPEDLEGITVFLASDASAYITGTVIPVDGGYQGR